MLYFYTEKFNENNKKKIALYKNNRLGIESYEVFTNAQPLELESAESKKKSNLRRLNRTIELILKTSQNSIEHLKSQLLVDEVLLNYKFAYNKFKCYFNLANFNSISDFRYETAVFMDNHSHSIDSLSILLRLIYIRLSHLLNKYPNSLSTILCSRLLSLYKESSHVYEFINSCDQYSIDKCSLVAVFQSEPFIECDIMIHNLFTNVVDYKESELDVILSDTEIIFYKHDQDETFKPKKIIKFTPRADAKYEKIMTFEREDDSYDGVDAILISNNQVMRFNYNTSESKVILKIKTGKIRNILLLGDLVMIVLLENSKSLQFHSLDDAKCTNFDCKKRIKFVFTDFPNHWGWMHREYKTPMTIGVLLEDDTIVIYETLYSEHDFKVRNKLDKPLKEIFMRKFEEQIHFVAMQTTVDEKNENKKLFIFFESKKFASLNIDLNDKSQTIIQKFQFYCIVDILCI